jgi:sialate O-acetylesterase
MRTHRIIPPIIVCLSLFPLVVCSSLFSQSELSLPALFSDNMVLQAGSDAACWGWAAAGDSLKIEFLPEGSSPLIASARADAGGRWETRLPALTAGQNGVLVISSSSGEKKQISNVLVGEVWLASGQSNMAFDVKRSATFPVAHPEESFPEIRLFKIGPTESAEPRKDVKGAWVVATPQSAGNFSAVAWFFGAYLQRELNVPVGLIQSAWGGTPIETWISPDEMAKFPSEAAQLNRAYEKKAAAFPDEERRYTTLLGEWKRAASGRTDPAPKPPEKPRIQNTPSRCYNGMIHGLEPYTMRGILWYQGESNAGRPEPYRKLFPALVTSWRESFRQPDLFFFYVELAGYAKPENKEGGWARIRESQESVLALPNTGVATAIDVGDANDIHPKNKQPVGERLALLALGESYRKPGLHQSPQFRNAEVEGAKIRVSLDHATGLRSRTPEIQSFAIQGKDGVWLDAQASIEGEQVVVWNPHISEPRAVRYGWQSYPRISLENAAGLPLRPFRTDR